MSDDIDHRHALRYTFGIGARGYILMAFTAFCILAYAWWSQHWQWALVAPCVFVVMWAARGQNYMDWDMKQRSPARALTVEHRCPRCGQKIER